MPLAGKQTYKYLSVWTDIPKIAQIPMVRSTDSSPVELPSIFAVELDPGDFVGEEVGELFVVNCGLCVVCVCGGFTTMIVVVETPVTKKQKTK